MIKSSKSPLLLYFPVVNFFIVVYSSIHIFIHCHCNFLGIRNCFYNSFGSTYKVRVHFSTTSTETMSDKIKRILRNEIQQM